MLQTPMHRVSALRRGLAGFTLIELMVVVAIIGILASVAYPAYTSQIAKGRRAQAQATLLSAAQYLQRFYVAKGSYSTATLPTAMTTTEGHDIALNISGEGFSLTATPKTGKADADCNVITLTDTGAKSVSGSKGLSYCWK